MIRMLEKTLTCKNCGFTFRLSLTEEEWEKGGIPCPGCAETALEESNEEASAVLSSTIADCSGDCSCCPAACGNK
ncbi:MAG: hypothetical protein E7458_07730 [Ruminococcaceae bacterium]|nr:hypothetical protein [Oscillospiraceae bacterium]